MPFSPGTFFSFFKRSSRLSSQPDPVPPSGDDRPDDTPATISHASAKESRRAPPGLPSIEPERGDFLNEIDRTLPWLSGEEQKLRSRPLTAQSKRVDTHHETPGTAAVANADAKKLTIVASAEPRQKSPKSSLEVAGDTGVEGHNTTTPTRKSMQILAADSTLPSPSPTSKLLPSWKSPFKSDNNNSNRSTSSSSSNKTSIYHHTMPLSKSKSGRSRLTILNPIHLLTHRHTSLRSSWSGSGDIPAPKFSDDYDPCIRGNQLHEFGATKTSGKPTPPPTSPIYPPKQSQPSQPDPQPQQSSDPVEPLQSGQVEGPVPAETAQEVSNTRPSDSPISFGNCEAANQPDSEGLEPAAKGNDDTPGFEYLTLPGLRASRFSFDLSENEGERILEEKAKQLETEHRQSLIGKKFKHDSGSSFDDMGEFDAFDYDGMLDDDNNAYSIEEPVPGVNTDAVEENDHVRDVNADLDSVATGSTITQYNEDSPTMPVSLATDGSDDKGRTTADSLSLKEPTNIQHPVENDLRRDSTSPDGAEPERDAAVPAVPIVKVDMAPDNEGSNMPNHEPSPIQQKPHRLSLDIFQDDDFYFYDAAMDAAINGGNVPAEAIASDNRNLPAFDESMFDDETSYLYDKNHINSLKLDSTRRPHPLGEGKKAGGQSLIQASDTITERKAATAELDLHEALAKATAEASLNGRFNRNPEFDAGTSHPTIHDEEENGDDEPPRKGSLPTIALDTQIGTGTKTPPLEVPDPDEEFTLGAPSALGDDPHPFYDDIDGKIAEANADALQNDDDGFYGSEFGFYAHAPSDTTTNESPKEMVYGGYFGESTGIHHSNSGRGGNCHEPSLTPITERSERSTRNSMISLAQQQALAGANPASTGVAAAAEATQNDPSSNSTTSPPLDEPDMTLGALMKLRRNTFRDSSGSLVNTPPQSPRPPHNNNASIPPSPSSLNSYGQSALSAASS